MGGTLMSKPSYAQAMRIAKQVKLNLASGAESGFRNGVHYQQPVVRNEQTVVDIANKLHYEQWLLKQIFQK